MSARVGGLLTPWRGTWREASEGTAASRDLLRASAREGDGVASSARGRFSGENGGETGSTGPCAATERHETEMEGIGGVFRGGRGLATTGEETAILLPCICLVGPGAGPVGFAVRRFLGCWHVAVEWHATGQALGVWAMLTMSGGCMFGPRAYDVMRSTRTDSLYPF